MKFTIAIDFVSGDGFLSLITNDAQSALNFLSRYDHEGSIVEITIEFPPEQGYEFLRSLANPKN